MDFIERLASLTFSVNIGNESEDQPSMPNLETEFVSWLTEFVTWISESAAGTDYLTELSTYSVDCLFRALWVTLYFVAVFLLSGFMTYAILPKPMVIRPRKRVLIVTAHPEDECLFFGPTILNLKESCDVFLLCLSKGANRLIGQQRKKELYDSCSVLGIPRGHVLIMNCTFMPDDELRMWSPKRVARIVRDYIEAMSIHEVCTFDIGGVNGHWNHSSIYYGFARLMLKGQLPSNCKVFLLDTVNKLRKYSGIADATLSSSPLSQRLFWVSLADSCIIREAMRKHQSQWVWYRKAYIYTSRYIYLNTYREMKLEDVELDLQLADYNPLLY